MNLSNYHVKFVRVITHLFPILHSHTPQKYHENNKDFWDYRNGTSGRNRLEWIKSKNKTNLKCHDNTSDITRFSSILPKF